MCNSPACSHNDSNPFADLDDDMDDIFGGPVEDRAPSRPLPTLKEAAEAVGMGYTEKCRNCRGTGQWRPGYPCFACKGKGTKTFKTSSAERAKAADARNRAAERKANEIREKVEIFAVEHADDFAWMKAKAGSFDFATSMLEALNKYGSLTERQHATVTRLRLADIERAAARKAEAEQRAANAPAVDVALIEQAFARAQENGIKRPRMVLDGLKFSLAPAHGRNAGALYVVRKDDDQYLGKIMGGRFQRVRECDEATEARVVAIASDPHGEAVAYGRRTGNCCICNRELTNHASIDAGIGPICAAKYGW